MAEKLAAKTYARIPDIYALPNLIEVQLNSFNWFIEQGLRELFDEVSPIESFNGALKLYFPGDGPEARQFGLSFWFEEPKFNQKECLERDLTFARGLYIKVALVNSETNEHVVNDIFLGEFPWMTENGTFIYNGTERVVVSQLIRSPGVYFDADPDPSSGRALAHAKVIPDRGAWMEFETRKSDYITLKFNRKRTIPVTILLRAMAAIDDGTGTDILKTGTDEEILRLFEHIDNNPDHQYILTTIRQEGNLSPRDKRSLAEEALLEFYRKMRPGDPPTMDNARSYLTEQLFDRRRYDLERVGRYKLNQRLGLSTPVRTITKADMVKLVEHMIKINNGLAQGDDIDHLGNRRVKTVGELIQNKLRIGLRRMERVVKERMSIREAGAMTPIALVNIRPVVAAIREFFGSSQSLAIHGSNQSAGGIASQAHAVGPRPRRSAPRARGLRRARRAPFALWPHLPDRDAGRPEHRLDRPFGDLWPREHLWLYRDAVSPRGEIHAEYVGIAGGAAVARGCGRSPIG